VKKGLLVLFLLLCSKLHPLSLSLEDAERIALGENQPYLISQEEVYQADQQRLGAYSKWMPQISYNSFFAHTFEPTLVENINTGTFFYKKNLVMNRFEMNQTIFSSDLLYNIKKKTLEKKSTEERGRGKKNDLLLNVRGAYFSALLFEKAVQIQKENVNYLKSALEVETGKYQAGNATLLETNQSKVAVSNAISQYYNTLKQLKVSKNALVKALGIDPHLGGDIQITEDDFPIYEKPLLSNKLNQISLKNVSAQNIEFGEEKELSLFSDAQLDDFISQAIKEKPDLQSYKTNVNIAEKTVSESYGKYLPEVTAFVDYQKNAGEPSSRLFSKDPFSWAAGIKISWDIFDGLLRERKIKEAVSKRSSSKLRYKYALNQVEIEVRDVLSGIEDALYSYVFASESVKVAEMAAKQAREKLSFGKIPPLDYRDAVNQLAQAKNLKNRSSFQVIMAYYQLRYDIGIDANN